MLTLTRFNPEPATMDEKVLTAGTSYGRAGTIGAWAAQTERARGFHTSCPLPESNREELFFKVSLYQARSKFQQFRRADSLSHIRSSRVPFPSPFYPVADVVHLVADRAAKLRSA